MGTRFITWPDAISSSAMRRWRQIGQAREARAEPSHVVEQGLSTPNEKMGMNLLKAGTFHYMHRIQAVIQQDSLLSPSPCLGLGQASLHMRHCARLLAYHRSDGNNGQSEHTEANGLLRFLFLSIPNFRIESSFFCIFWPVTLNSICPTPRRQRE